MADQPIWAEIAIHHHAIHCIIGVHPHERQKKQVIYVDIEVKANIKAAAHSDSLSDAPVDYIQLAKVADQLAHEHSFHLLETLAYQLLEKLFANFPIIWTKIVIKKPEASHLARYATIEIERSLEDKS